MLFGAWLLSAKDVRAAEWSDLFSERQTVEEASGQLSGNNSGATAEDGEPEHGGKHPRHSLWLSWIAPTNGLATLRIVGASFDTVLGVYRLKKNAPPNIHELERVAENDDDRVDSSSSVQFGTRTGERYEIAVDGYRGATGDLTLRWELEPATRLLPVILQTDADRAVRAGDTVTLSVALDTSEGLDLHWYFNDREIDDEDRSTLVIRNFQASDAGQYRVRIKLDDLRFFSEPVEVQISSEGGGGTLARNKPEDALESPLVGTGAEPGLRSPLSTRRLALQAAPGAGVSRGYNGSQIFNTAYAGRDPLEPQHCGVAGGASYWFAYQPPASGVVDINSDGSSFDTVLAVYTYNPPLAGYQDLIPVACDDNSGANSSTSRLQFNCERDRFYLVVLDGAQGARGLAHLNYRLSTGPPPPIPPSLTTQPVSQTVVDLSPVTLSVSATGTPPFAYQWFKDGIALTGANTETLSFPNVTPDQAGIYTVTVTNLAGSVQSQPATLTVLVPPSLTTQPASQTVIDLSPVTLSVSATGTPPFAYQWFKDGIALTGANTETLSFPNVTPGQAGTYTVTVTNLAGSVQSQPATLTVLVPPSLSTQPASQTVIDPSPVTLSVSATGTPPFAYQWFKDGIALTGANTETLSFPNVTPSQAGTYTVTVTNLAGSVQSQPATLTVLVPPSLTTQPVSQTVVDLSPVTLFVSAAGTPPFAYQWFKDGNPLPDTNTETLSFPKVTPGQVGTYTVTVTNLAGSVQSQPATLTVLVPPSLSTQPVSQTVVDLSPVTLSVSATGTPPFAYQWFKDGIALPNANTETLSFPKVTPGQAGIYTVTVTNLAGSVQSQPATLTVLVPPSLTTQPASQTVIDLSPVTLFVSAAGTPPFAYQWFKDGIALLGANTETLSFPKVTPAQAGTYTVTVTNLAGSVQSQPATLTVLVPPSLTTQPASQTVIDPSPVTLFVSAAGTPPFAYQWFKDGIALTGANTETLSFPNVTPDQAGIYTVTVTNLAGSVQSQPATLTVLVPPSLTTQPASQTAIDPSPVTLFVSAAGTPPFAYQWFKDGIALPSANTETLSFPNVTPVQAGIYTVTVTNLAGSVQSQPATLTVLVPPSLTTQPASQTVVDQSAVTLSVSATGTPPFAYQWFKDGIALPNANTETLSFPNVAPGQAGRYDVVVRSDAGSIRSVPAMISVWAPPQVIRDNQAQRMVIRYVATGSLRARVEFTEDLAHGWQPWPGPIEASGEVTLEISLNSGRQRFVRVIVE